MMLEVKFSDGNDFEVAHIDLNNEFSVKGMNIVNILDNKDYNSMINKPSVNGEVLEGNQTFEDLGVASISNLDIVRIVDKQFEEIFGG